MTDTKPKAAGWQIAKACGIAALWAIGCFFFVEWARPDSGVVSVSFTIIQPAAICAFIAYVGDPLGTRSRRYYALVPLVSGAGMVLVSVFVLQEGAVCIAMLAPLWILFGMAGTLFTWMLRDQNGEDNVADTFAAHGLLVLPMIALFVETTLTPPIAHYTVTDEVVIDAPAEEIWPLMQGMGHVDPDAGQWNISQSVIGIPRPRFAQLDGKGVGARRHARWDRGVYFDEVVDRWEPGRNIGWQFDFTQSDGWDITDPHLRPDGPYMRIQSGGYELEPLPDGRHLLRLHTTYAAQTHFNGYAALWGDLFLGDIQANVLEVIRQKAEGR
ncbi:SRPBCC family protein [Aurantiacibacter sp. MUD61]|uniref:SRPBCC family protein n=1 Tax=Aurantiacibacter sp. MUD61 TaxID=3009083 RepID=UPI0022EFE6D1|nr:SRPBCC family protein [Aurantiacibacter sp. MUD61]